MQGGVADYTQALGRVLVAMGHEVGILTSLEAKATAEVGIRVWNQVDRWDWGVRWQDARRPGKRLATARRPYSISNRGLWHAPSHQLVGVETLAAANRSHCGHFSRPRLSCPTSCPRRIWPVAGLLQYWPVAWIWRSRPIPRILMALKQVRSVRSKSLSVAISRLRRHPVFPGAVWRQQHSIPPQSALLRDLRLSQRQ